MSKLFPGLLAVAPVFPVSRDCERTGLTAGTYATTPHESSHPD
ncbi:hypothetical protein [Candidatus Cryosericum terrychapinii]|jgi:hypothetical protein|nr:hypothetical protein [Candidatus Cryosericum terrychapinii]